MSKKPFASRAAEQRGAYVARSGQIQVSQDIMPIAELKSKLGDVVRSLDTRRPIVVTLNGKAAAVLMSPAEFDRLTYEQRVRAAIKEGLDDIEAGRVHDGEEVFAEILGELDAQIGATKAKKRRKR